MNANIFTSSISKGIQSRPDIEAAGKVLKESIYSKFGRSFQIREVDTGSCGACESEIYAALNPLYDMQRFGIDFVASPRHADALLVAGPVSKNMVLALKKTYNAMPAPKYVIALGDCARDGGPFAGAYNSEDGVGKILKVDLYISGCPPDPLVIIRMLTEFLSSFKI